MALTPEDIDELYNKCLLPAKKDIITPRSVYTYCVSPFMVYCKKFGPENKKDPLTLYQEMLFDQGEKHEKNVVNTQCPDLKKMEYKTKEEGFKIFLEEMSKGVKVFWGAPVFYLPEGLLGVLDMVEKQGTHSSLFGEYHYIVKEIKYAKNIQKHHTYQGALYTYILGKIQGYTPPVFYVINRDGKEFKIDYKESELLEILKDIREIYTGKEVSPTYGACEWPWKTYNNEEAIKRRDVSLVSGVGYSFKQKLVHAGIYTIDDLARKKMDDLINIKGIGKKTAQKFLVNSRSLVSKECKLLAPCTFPEKCTEIFLDLEGSGEHVKGGTLIAIDCLIGVLTRKEGKKEYISFVAHGLEKERDMFYQFVEWLLHQDDFIMYHWHNYERVHLKKMAEQYELDNETQKILFDNMRDLYKDAVSCCVFPTYRNGLKDIAHYMGYEWKHKDVDALESIALYFQYVEDPEKNKDKLQKVIDYNQDDCRATMVIKDWLKRNLSRIKKQ
ncbi:MAG: TM0106 family RecB-like putative nuclease [Candidatus Methanofastidiosia archaeon]|jgi:uncharacterized protein